jgi:enoyl-CoA hydratase/carnithine racemase
VRGAGSEFALACDLRFAARKSAIVGQFEPAFGVLPGEGAAQHLARLMGRARAIEVLLSEEDYDADLAEQYGWINRALPASELVDFVRSLAHRIAEFPAAGHVAVKARVNAIALAAAEDYRMRFRSLRQGRVQPLGLKPDLGRNQARLPDSRSGNAPGPDAGRPGSK